MLVERWDVSTVEQMVDSKVVQMADVMADELAAAMVLKMAAQKAGPWVLLTADEKAYSMAER
jgi:hypothetical protein